MVVGGGSWGTAFALAPATTAGTTVTLACRDAEQARTIARDRTEPAVPHERRPGGGSRRRPWTTRPSPEAVSRGRRGPELAVRLRSSPPFPGSAPLLSLTKGLDPATGERLSTLVTLPARSPSCPGRTWPRRSRAGSPVAAVIASEDECARGLKLQNAVNSLVFRVYVNADLVGVELCAAAKNVIALAAGGVDGLGLGDNAKAALITRGLAEMGAARRGRRRAPRDIRRARRDG